MCKKRRRLSLNRLRLKITYAILFRYHIIEAGMIARKRYSYNKSPGKARAVSFMVRLARFEPATHGLEGRCSIQLSYRRTKWSG